MTTHSIAGTVAATASLTGDLIFSRPRYRLTAVLSERRPVMDVINDILTTCQGRCWWSDGQWHFAVDDKAAQATYSGSGATYATGKHGKAIRLDQEGGGSSTDEHLVLTVADAGIEVAAGTIEAWVKLTSLSTDQYIFDGTFLKLWINSSGKLKAEYDDGAAPGLITLTGSTTISTGAWYHVALTWGASGGAIYFNGALEDDDATAADISSFGGLDLLWFGNAYGSNVKQLRGYLDDVRISTTQHDAATIAADYATALIEPLPCVADTCCKLPFDDSLDAVKFLITDPRTASNTLTANIPILSDGRRSSLRAQRTLIEAPNTAVITYIDPDDYLSREARYETAAVSAGTDQPRELRLRGYGIPGGNQAYRLAKQWILQAQRTLRLGVRVPQHGLRLAPGDVGHLTSAIGPLTSKLVRVNGITDNADGSFEVELLEYSGDECSVNDTYTPERVTIPGADNSDVEFVTFEDDFRSGGTSSGSLGELGWTEVSVSGSVTYTYSTEAGHPGILKAAIGSAETFVVGLSGSNNLFAARSQWFTKYIFRVQNLNGGGTADAKIGIYDGSTWLHYLLISADDTVSVDGVSTGLTAATTDWITYRIWCDGGTTAYYEISWGANVVTGSFSVSSTTIKEYLAFYGGTTSGGNNVTFFVDYASLALIR